LQAGRPEEAVVALERALDQAPGAGALERRLGMALVHAGDPVGKEILRNLALQAPEDEELRAYLEEGPPPPVPLGYFPATRGATAPEQGQPGHAGHHH
ncbi:MAG: tetratricopeptide repeat protein, partial [Chloroflexi bacterium]|nr:tetratricopeptide repeat protein [Chloroflexota bacterium]